MPLHDRGDHPVLRRPAPDVVVERVAFADLLLDLVAAAAGHKDEDRTIPATSISHEDIEHILWMRSERLIACDCDTRIQLTFESRRCGVGGPVSVVVVFRHERPIQPSRARRVDDLPDLFEALRNIWRYLG